jgi:hypothetical protein
MAVVPDRLGGTARRNRSSRGTDGVFLSPHAFRAAAEEIPRLFIGRLRKVFVELTYPIEWFWCDSADNLVCFVLHFSACVRRSYRYGDDASGNFALS